MAGGITALIAVLIAVIIVVFILLRYCMHSRQSLCLDYVFLRYQKNTGRKYSLKEGNLSIVRKAHPTDSRAVLERVRREIMKK